jgi:hypothetical protein
LHYDRSWRDRPDAEPLDFSRERRDLAGGEAVVVDLAGELTRLRRRGEDDALADRGS